MSTERPHLTVATLVEDQGRLLMVKEHADGKLVYNQPAGHVEYGESLIAAAIRETREETAWDVSVSALLGIYEYTSPANGITYVRLCFVASPRKHDPMQALDSEIAAALWLTPVELEQLHGEMRSPLVMAAVADYLAGKRYPLSLLANF